MMELKALVGFGLSCGELLAGLGDGFSFDDVKKVIDCAKQASPALKGAKAALGQYLVMSDEQAKELEDFVIADFDIADDQVEFVIESALKVAIELHGLASIFAPKPA